MCLRHLEDEGAPFKLTSELAHAPSAKEFPSTLVGAFRCDLEAPSGRRSQGNASRGATQGRHLDRDGERTFVCASTTIHEGPCVLRAERVIAWTLRGTTVRSSVRLFGLHPIG